MTTSGHDGPGKTDTAVVSANPTIEGAARGLVEAVLGAAVAGAIVYFEVGPEMPAEIVAYVPIIIVVLRTLEGVLDSSQKG